MTNRRRVAAVSAVAALALAGGVAAQFSTSTSSAPQQIGTGTMAISFSNVAPTVWTDPIENLAAGDSVQRFVDIRNSGTLKIAAVTIAQQNTLGDLLTAPSDVVVKMDICSVAWNTTDGTCAGIRSVALDTSSVVGWGSTTRNLAGFTDFGAGEVKHVKVTTNLSAQATNDVQGKQGQITYTLNGFQRAPDQITALSRTSISNASIAQASLSNSLWTSTAVPQISANRYGEGGASDSRGGVYLIGGYLTGAKATASVERYSDFTGAWSQVAPMSVPRAYIGTINDPFGNIYAIGGYDGTTVLNSVEKYNPSTNVWSTVAPMNTERWSASVASDAAGNIYVMGGRNQAGRFLNSVEKYDPTTNVWTQLPNMPDQLRYAAGSTDLDGNLYVIGGNKTGSVAINTVSKYTVSTGKWSTVAPLNTARMESQALTAADGKIYVFGGWSAVNGVNTRYATTEVYNPSTNTWSAGPTLSTPRISFAAAKDSAGRMYVMGGLGSDSFTKVVERLG